MAERPVFMAKEDVPFYRQVNVNFGWNGGFAVSQKQKNIHAIHEAFKDLYPEKKCLEISSKSYQEGGKLLSAFSLQKYVPSLEKSVPVECAYQSGKVFAKGGPYTDLLFALPRDAKRDDRLKSSGKLIKFVFDGVDFPIEPKTIFYDYLYINAIFENRELAAKVLEYDAFTDIEFNPDKSLNCQAKAAATFVSLTRLGLIDKVRDIRSFCALYSAGFGVRQVAQNIGQKDVKPKPEEKKQVNIDGGSVLRHPSFGTGSVKEIEGNYMVIMFPDFGEKKLSFEWVLKNCEILKK